MSLALPVIAREHNPGNKTLVKCLIYLNLEPFIVLRRWCCALAHQCCIASYSDISVSGVDVCKTSIAVDM